MRQLVRATGGPRAHGERGAAEQLLAARAVAGAGVDAGHVAATTEGRVGHPIKARTDERSISKPGQLSRRAHVAAGPAGGRDPGAAGPPGGPVRAGPAARPRLRRRRARARRRPPVAGRGRPWSASTRTRRRSRAPGSGRAPSGWTTSNSARAPSSISDWGPVTPPASQPGRVPSEFKQLTRTAFRRPSLGFGGSGDGGS